MFFVCSAEALRNLCVWSRSKNPCSTYKVAISTRICGIVLRVLHLYYKAAIFEPELRICTSHTTFVLQSCDFRSGAAQVYFLAGAVEAYFTYDTCATLEQLPCAANWAEKHNLGDKAYVFHGSAATTLLYIYSIFQTRLKPCSRLSQKPSLPARSARA